MHDHVSDSLGDEHMNDFDATKMHDIFVDHEAFRHLLTRTTDLEKQVAGLNENISCMSDLFNQFMCQQAMSGRGEHLREGKWSRYYSTRRGYSHH